MRLLINTNDGSVIPLEGTYLIVLGEGDDKTRKQDLYDEWCEHGANEVIEQLGRQHGKALDAILTGCGDGDLRYGNCIALTPITVKEEIAERVAGGYFVEEEEDVLKTFTYDDWLAITESILNTDYIWNVFHEELGEAIREQITKREKTDKEVSK